MFRLIFLVLFLFASNFSLDIDSFAQQENQKQLLSIDKIVIHKSQRKMEVYKGDNLLKTYKIALGFSPVGHKIQQGDGKTPEGSYVINYKNNWSSYHKSLKISYPNSQDLKEAKKASLDPGGDIYIHGLGKKFGYIGSMHTMHDWTLGCIAVTNDEIEEIWDAVCEDTPVIINP